MSSATDVSPDGIGVNKAAPSGVKPRSIEGKSRSHWNSLLGLSFAVIALYCFVGSDASSEHAKYFPPFRTGVLANMVSTLGGEYYNIALAIEAGRGFSDPFLTPSGPTAWMPPLIPYLLAPLILITGNSVKALVVIWLGAQLASVTLCFALVRRMLPGRPPLLIFGTFLLLLTMQFRLTFQSLHDYSLLMLLLNGCLYWDFCRDPLADRRSTILWGIFGGVIMLSAPVIALVWCGLTIRRGIRNGARRHLVLAAVIAGAILTPWIVRNAVVFGRFIPLKSNLYYELYQSHFETPEGVIDTQLFPTHPANDEKIAGTRAEYIQKGEMAFLDDRKYAFLSALKANPSEFARRVGNRFLAAFVWYRTLDEELEPPIPGALTFSKVVHTLPTIACLVLIAGAYWRPLNRVQIGVLLAYLVCLAPYVIVSYYDRYTYPLLGLKVLLVVWAIERLSPKPAAISTES